MAPVKGNSVNGTFQESGTNASARTANSTPISFEMLVTGGCSSGECPTVYELSGDADNFYVQGYNLEAQHLAALPVPDGEGLVRIPRSLIEQLVNKNSK